MPKRRKFLIGLGSLAAGTAAATGTGAFSTTQASRGFSVSTSGDATAELALTGAGSSNEYVTDNGVKGELEITFDNLNPNAVVGVNKLFTIKNNASHSVDVWGEPEGPHADKVVFPRRGYGNDSNSFLRQSATPTISADILDADDEDGATTYNSGSVGQNSGARQPFGPGQSDFYSMVVDTRDIEPGETILNKVTIFADNFDA